MSAQIINLAGRRRSRPPVVGQVSQAQHFASLDRLAEHLEAGGRPFPPRASYSDADICAKIDRVAANLAIDVEAPFQPKSKEETQ